MSTQAIILCVVAVLSWSAVAAHNLVPPQGFSVGFTGKVSKGTQKYVCKSGCWVKTGSSADMYAPDGSKLGNYWSAYDQTTQSTTYSWNIINSGGNSVESGQSSCGLEAAQLKAYEKSQTAIPEYLAIVKKRSGSGDADQVAFISLTGTQGGLPPRKELCLATGVTAGVPFYGNFTFYTQDRQPPQNLPASIAPKGTFVQVVFLDGNMRYKFTAGKWRYAGFFATILDVAGGNVLGRVGNAAKPTSYGNLLWKFNDPNGFWLQGFQCAQPYQMDTEGCPWRLMKITTSGGSQ
ncbi:hypothetical protein KC19_1G148900 [Ceratodon purpureus]|nr:hypothetical protein KC19_1G148900 [Ceratodon purpureus]KAG0591091.1 hypothetical protein KC19_1G148900 [Ceratodon purpureus]